MQNPESFEQKGALDPYYRHELASLARDIQYAGSSRHKDYDPLTPEQLLEFDERAGSFDLADTLMIGEAEHLRVEKGLSESNVFKDFIRN